MPTYEYKCESCGEVFEVRQKFIDEPLKLHEGCGGAVERLISAPALQFKGTGWYVTDYARKDSNGRSAAEKSDKAAEKSEKASKDSKKDSSSSSDSSVSSSSSSSSSPSSTSSSTSESKSSTSESKSDSKSVSKPAASTSTPADKKS